jgi:hypothetical protein
MFFPQITAPASYLGLTSKIINLYILTLNALEIRRHDTSLFFFYRTLTRTHKRFNIYNLRKITTMLTKKDKKPIKQYIIRRAIVAGFPLLRPQFELRAIHARFVMDKMSIAAWSHLQRQTLETNYKNEPWQLDRGATRRVWITVVYRV